VVAAAAASLALESDIMKNGLNKNLRQKIPSKKKKEYDLQSRNLGMLFSQNLKSQLFC